MPNSNFNFPTPKDDIQFVIITEDDFICGNCANCSGEVIACANFERRKPISIFLYNICAEYIPKDIK